MRIEAKVKLRLSWVRLYQELKHAGKVCDHYGISRFTLRKWYKRYNLQGEDGLRDSSSKPNTFPFQKRTIAEENLILNLRKERKLGARRIQSELKRLYNISFSLDTIHKVLKNNNVAPLKLKRHYRKQIKRYNCKIPGERLQMDVCKIAANLYQYTAIDDCSRYKVLGLYNRRTSANTVDFLAKVITKMPFPIQRIQTDRGQEFLAYIVQDYLREQKIKLRPIKPLSPYLNGKVERSQKTDLDEFYSSINPKDSDLPKKLEEWEYYYNYQRSHSTLKGKTPYEKYQEMFSVIPSLNEVQAKYNPSKERIVLHNYKYDQISKLFGK